MLVSAPKEKKYNQAKEKRTLILTKEHGSWIILLVPMITGILISGKFNPFVLSLALSIIFLFLSYTPAEIILHGYLKKQNANTLLRNARYWFSIFSPLSIVFGLTAIILAEKYFLLLFLVIAILLFSLSIWIVIRKRKNVFSDLLATAGLTLSAPALVYYLNGSLVNTGIYLWLFNFMFFGSGAVYVHMKIRISSLKKKKLSTNEKLSIGKLNLLFHFVSITFLLLGSINHVFNAIIGLAFFPGFTHAILGTFLIPAKTSFKKIGLTYTFYSLIFTIFVIVALR
jgi:hypothetical protein